MKFFLLIHAAFGMIFYPFFLRIKKNVFLKGKIKIKGFPYIDLRNNSKLFLGSNVMLNSTNYGYHINMFKGVKILADGQQAEIHIGTNTRIHGTCIHAKSKITIGKNCLIAANCHIVDSNGHPTDLDSPQNRGHLFDKPKEIIIQDNVWIAANCMILKGVTIGEGSIVAAGSVVVENVPSFSIVRGNPAKVIKNRT
jgi:acetyltransferase-like isoleucine patch superfamily enzyme